MSATIKNNNFPLRFRTKAQKNAAKRLARKQRDSLNSYLLSLVDKDIEFYKEVARYDIIIPSIPKRKQ